VERYRTYLYQVVLSVVRHPKDAEDVTQEAFLKIYRSLSQYRQQGFKTWITRIAVNKAIDHTRKLRNAKEETVASMEEWVPDGGPPEGSWVEEILLRKEKSAHFYRRLQELPDNYRDVVIAFYIEEKSYQQIAADQTIELKTVESKLYRARQWIRKHWKEEDFR
jgi:RNA polymerase sigma factor (sigma-70 family)